MNLSKNTKFSDLANSNLADLIVTLPECRQSAICFLISGDPYIIPFSVYSEEPVTRDMLALFSDRTVLRIRDDITYPSYSFENFMASLPPIIRNQDHPHYVKRFIRMSQSLLKEFEESPALPVTA